MAALTEDRHLESKHFGNTLRKSFDCAASEIVYGHSYVGLNSGNARALNAGDTFLGVAIRRTDNSEGAAGDRRVDTEQGQHIKVTISGADADDLGKIVYASDDNTETLTVGSNTAVGELEQYLGSNTFWMRVYTTAESVRISDLEARTLANDAKTSA